MTPLFQILFDAVTSIRRCSTVRIFSH